MIEGEMGDDRSRPGMPDDNGLAHVELPQGAREERGLPGGLGLAQAPLALAPAMARTVEGDDPVALREGRAETEHGFDEVGRGAVQEDDGAARGVALGPLLPVMDPAALDLDE